MRQTQLFMILNLAIGIMAVLATGALFGGGPFGYLGALLIALVAPQVVAIIAVAGAIQAWGWHWLAAVTVFMWPLVLTLLALFGVIAGGAGLGAFYSWKMRRGDLRRDTANRSRRYGDSGDMIEGEFTVVDNDEN